MKLDRNRNGDGLGKYALIKLRALDEFIPNETFGMLAPDIAKALKVLEEAGIIDLGIAGTESEFFVIRLKDKYAKAALQAYFFAIENDPDGDLEYAMEIDHLCGRAGPDSQWCKKPD